MNGLSCTIKKIAGRMIRNSIELIEASRFGLFKTLEEELTLWFPISNLAFHIEPEFAEEKKTRFKNEFKRVIF